MRLPCSVTAAIVVIAARTTRLARNAFIAILPFSSALRRSAAVVSETACGFGRFLQVSDQRLALAVVGHPLQRHFRSGSVDLRTHFEQLFDGLLGPDDIGRAQRL